MTIPDIPHTWTQHTHSESFELTQELRIPQSRHHLQPQPAPFYFQFYDEADPPQPIYWWAYTPNYWGAGVSSGGYDVHLDPASGDFVFRLHDPLPMPIHGTIVLTGILDARWAVPSQEKS